MKSPFDNDAPLKIAFLSDFHCGSANYKLADLSKTVDQVNREKPDLVILGGDYVNQYDSPDAPKGWGGPLDPGFEPPETIAKELGRLKAEAGVFAVLGNHDYHLGGERVAQALNANGITVLANSSAMTRARGQDFAVAGVDDHTQTPDGDVTLKGVPYGKPHVVVGHNPTDLQDMRGDAGVMMAGHTHGGQVGGRLLTALCKLPFMQRLIHSPWGEKHFPKELKEHLESPQGITESRGGAPLYVSSGLGTSSAPLRFGPGAEREVAIITLSGKNPFEPDEAGQKPATTAPPTRKAGEKLGM